MNAASQSISQWGIFGLIIGVLALIAAIYAIVRATALHHRMHTLLGGGGAQSIEELLLSHLRERDDMRSRITSLETRAKALESKLETSKRHLGIVRYDAFPDVGGSQSFAYAFYDDQGDGGILTAITGREGTRIYCKPLVRGRSDRALSQEEERAIEEAYQKGTKAVIS